MAVTANELAVALFDAAVGGYKDTVDAFIYAQGETSAAEMMLRESGLASNPDNSVFAYLVVAKMTGDTLTEAQKEAAADILVGWLAAGQSRGQVVLAAIDYLMSDAAAADATYGDAAMRFQNKVTAADNYAGNSTDVPTLVAVLAGVTEDPATIDTAAQGDTFVLTTVSENVVGTVGNDTIKGIFGDDAAVTHSTTYGAGDSVDGGTGTDTLQLVAVGTDASAIVQVANVEAISITDLYGATFNATLVEDAPSISFVDTLAGQTSTVNHADLASVMGLSGKGNLTVDYASSTTTATTDAAHVSLAGAGTSATARSTVTVSDGNTIDSVSVATSGTNYVHLVAGTAAKTITITGDGTNNIDMSTVGDIAAIVTIDASASTGTNTLSVGSTLNTTDVVKGGTGADTLSANFTLATLIKPTVTGVETLKADFDAAAIVDLSSTTGLTTITLDGSTANQDLTKAAASVTTINVTSQGDTDNDIDFSHATDANADLTLNIGTTASTAADITLDTLTLDSTALTLNTVGTKAYDINGGIYLNGDQSAITVNANADLETAGINVDGGDVGSFDVNVGADASYSGGLFMSGDLGAINFTLGDGSFSEAYITNVGNVGDVTIEGTGEANMELRVSGNAGDISITLASQDASGSYFGAEVSGGSIGNITVSLDDNATLNLDVSANAFSFGDTDENGTDGNVGDVTVTLGDNTLFSGNIEASGGDVGNISVTVAGANASGNLDVYASFLSGDTDNDSSADDYVRGGNVGDVTLDITGDNAYFDLYVLASGGDIGDVVFNVTGQNASGNMELHANLQNSGGTGGDIGTVTIEAGDGNEFNLDLTADGVIGAVNVTMATDASGSISISGGNSGAAMLSDVTVDMGDGSDFYLSVSGFGGDVSDVMVTEDDNTEVDLHFAQISGDIGNISITTGDHASGNIFFSGNAGNIGDITLDGGADSEFYVAVSGGADSIGTITVIGGDSASSAGIYVQDTGNMIDSIGGVNASAWAGDLGINLQGVTTGTTIQTGTGNSWVEGTAGSDNIFLGSGTDTVYFAGVNGALDELFSFAKAKDVMDFDAFGVGTESAVADDAAAAATTDGNVYVFADGSNATTGETITDFADLTDVAAFLAAAFTDEGAGDEFIAVINTGGGAAYAYYVDVDLGAGGTTLDADAVQLVGIAHTDGALTVANTTF